MLLAVKIKAKATIYDTFAGYESYLYSGKKITPKVAVWYWNGKKYKKMPAKWYTCKPKANTKIGVYTFTVNYKKAYQKKYGKSMTGVYDICPKAPAISGVKAGKGSITVSWKKVAAKDQKNIDGFIIEYSMDKKMESEVYTAQVAGKGKTSTVIKGLEKGKTYYARVSTYKKVKKTAGHTEVWSYPSKAKSAKVK